MNFKNAIEKMKQGKKVRRRGWEDTWFVISDTGNLLCCKPNAYNKEQTDTKIDDLSLTNVEHILANDWEVVEEKKEKKEKKWWKPKNEENYYFIIDSGGVWYSNHMDINLADKRLQIGNCFQNEEEAEHMAEKLKIIHELEVFAYENNENLVWDDVDDEYKWYLVYSFFHKNIFAYGEREEKNLPFNVYFTSKKIAEKAIQTIGKERLKKYYFDVEE